MSQELIHLSVKKDAGGKAIVVDQHGRRVAKTRAVSYKQAMDEVPVVVIELIDQAADGRITTVFTQ